LSKPFSLKAILTAEELGRILKPKDIADRTCFLNVGLWMDGVCRDEAEYKSLSGIVFVLANEAAAPSSRNRAAVFMSLLKSQLGYKPPSCRDATAPQRAGKKSYAEKVQEQRRKLLGEGTHAQKRQ
jgi:hypothetical protein